MPIILDGTLGITTPALTVTGATVNTGGISTAGNLTFTSTGQRIIGDMSNATIANRVAFQTSTANSSTTLLVIPNGTGNVAQLNLESDSALANGVSFQILSNTGGAENRLQSGIRGTGTYLPMTFYTGGSERMRIDTSGNVGIGTTAQTTRLSFGSYIPANGQTLSIFESGNTKTGLGVVASVFRIYTDSTAAMSFGRVSTADGSTYTEQMRLDASGNLGIGVTAPASKLAVGGNPPSAGALAAVGANGGISLALSDNINSSLYVRNASGGPIIGNDGGNALRFATGGNTAAEERMRITAAGKVGIGLSNPNFTLSLNGSLNDFILGLYDNATYPYGMGIRAGTLITYAASDGALSFGNMGTIASSTYTERMNIDSSGNVKLSTAGTSILNSSGRPMVKQSGGILQVAQTVLSTPFSGTVTGSYQAVTSLAVTVTPSSSSSKFLVSAQISTTDSNNYPALFHIYRNGVQCTPNGPATGYTPSSTFAYSSGGSSAGAGTNQTISFQFLDSPATASAVTYQIYAAKPSVAGSLIQINNTSGGSSVITAMEIAG